MKNDIDSGTDALRGAVAARNKQQNLTYLAKEIGVSNEALHSFARGTTTLAADKLQALAGMIYGGNAEFVPELDRLRSVNKVEPVSLGIHPPRYVPPSDRYEVGTLTSAGPQPVKPTVKKVERQRKLGWV